MSRKSQEAGTFELLARLPQQIVSLIKIELANAKREVSAKLKRTIIGIVAVVIALFLVFFALEALVVAAIAGIAVVWPVWLSALVVGGGLILLAILAVLGGFLLMKRSVPVPTHTIDRVEGDLSALSEVKFNASAAPHAATNTSPLGDRASSQGARGQSTGTHGTGARGTGDHR